MRKWNTKQPLAIRNYYGTVCVEASRCKYAEHITTGMTDTTRRQLSGESTGTWPRGADRPSTGREHAMWLMLREIFMFTAKANDLKYYFVITDEAFSIVQNIDTLNRNMWAIIRYWTSNCNMEGTCSVNARESLARCGRCHLSFLEKAFVEASMLKRESNLQQLLISRTRGVQRSYS
jgi:hypothetical protein